MLLLNAFRDRESTASGKFDLGAAVTPSSLQLLINRTKGSGGIASERWNECAVVFLGSSVPGTLVRCRASRRRSS